MPKHIVTKETGDKISTALKASPKTKAAASLVVAKKAEEFSVWLSTNRPLLKTEDVYMGAMVKMNFTCSKHGGISLKNPNSLKNGEYGCPGCTAEARSKNNAAFKPGVREKAKQTMLQRHGAENPSQVQEFKRKFAESRIISGWKHLEGDHRWEQSRSAEWIRERHVAGMQNVNMLAAYFEVPREVMMGQMERLGVKLSRRHMMSQGEQEVRGFVESLGIVCESSNRKVLQNGKEIDIWVPSHNLGIEYNGIYWHTEDETVAEKTEQANKVGVQLIHVWEDDWCNRRETVERFLKNKLMGRGKSTGARSLNIFDLDNDTYRDFLECNHMQGASSTAKVRLGLRNPKTLELKAVMGFRDNGGGEWELVRFANTNVVGAFGKMEKHFIQRYSPASIKSFGDLEIINPVSNVYLNSGYVESHRLKPDYSYFGDRTGNMREHKFRWRKEAFARAGFDIEGKTEAVLAAEAGLARIFDAGKVCYIKHPNQ